MLLSISISYQRNDVEVILLLPQQVTEKTSQPWFSSTLSHTQTRAFECFL